MAIFDVIQTEVKARLGNRTDIGTRTAQWINDAMYEIAHNPRASFRTLDTLGQLTLAIGTTQYDLTILPSYWFVLAVIDDNTGRKLEQVHFDVIDKMQVGGSTSGDPIWYALYSSWMELYPVPSQGGFLNVRYRRRLEELSIGLPNLLDREWDEPLISLAVLKGLEALQRFEEAAQVRAVYDQQLAQRLDHLGIEEQQYETTIGVRFAY